MIYPLRPYQEAAFNDCRKALGKYDRIVLCSPTGSGKTVTFAAIARAAVERGKRVMIICHRKELIIQSVEKLNEYGLFPTIIAPKHKQTRNFCYVASIDTLVRREAPDVDLIIIDECHLVTFDRVFEIYPNTKTIGCTATPIRPWKKSLHLTYSYMVEPVKISQLIDGGYLVPARTISVKMEVDIKEKFNVQSGEYDYDEQELFKEFTKPGLYEGAIEQYKKFSMGKKAICFNVNVNHSKMMTEEFNRNGILSFHVDGNTHPDQRRQILRDFKEGRFRVLNNCGILTAGYDEPTIEAVIANFKTVSLSKWLQVAGRGGRLCEAIGKKGFDLIDMGGNIYSLGFWEQDREYNLEAKKPKRGSTPQAAPVKNCIECDSLLHASSPKCRYCGYVFPVKEKILLQGTFEEIKPTLIVPENNNTKLWAMTDEELYKYAAAKNYKKGWATKRIELRNQKKGISPESEGLDPYEV